MSVKLEGLPELEKALKKLIKQLGPDKVEPVLFSAAEDVADAIRARAPQGPTGNLKRSIMAKKMPRSGDNPTPSIAAVDRRIAPHAGLIEFGSSRHSAKPYFRPGWDAKRKKVRVDIEQALKELVEDGTK